MRDNVGLGLFTVGLVWAWLVGLVWIMEAIRRRADRRKRAFHRRNRLGPYLPLNGWPEGVTREDLDRAVVDYAVRSGLTYHIAKLRSGARTLQQGFDDLSKAEFGGAGGGKGYVGGGAAGVLAPGAEHCATVTLTPADPERTP